jgi:signal transduction histidine kinase
MIRAPRGAGSLTCEMQSPNLTRAATDAALAVAAFAGTIALLFLGDPARSEASGVVALAVTLAGLASLPLVARRRAPLAVFVITGLATVGLRLVAEPVGPPIGPTIALFGLAAGADGSRARTRWIVGAVLVMLLAHATAAGVADGRFPGTELVFGTLLWGATWLAGDRARLRQERMLELERRAEAAEREAEREQRLAAAEERTRIARDLHDSAGHAINVILVHAGAGRLHAERDPHAAREAFATIEEVARETVGEIDQMVGVLREGGGRADEAEPPGLAALEGLIERHRGAGLEISATVTVGHLPASVDRGAFRILQEALTNAARHGDGSARVEVAESERMLELTVENRLRPGLVEGSGHGLAGMRERAELLGGSLDAGARNGSFRVAALLPLEQV